MPQALADQLVGLLMNMDISKWDRRIPNSPLRQSMKLQSMDHAWRFMYDVASGADSVKGLRDHLEEHKGKVSFAGLFQQFTAWMATTKDQSNMSDRKFSSQISSLGFKTANMRIDETTMKGYTFTIEAIQNALKKELNDPDLAF